MYSMDDLLYLVHSDGADGLRLEVGQPPVIILDGEDQQIEGPVITVDDQEELLHIITDTRLRRELRAHGKIEFVYRFRHCASFVVRATVRDGNVVIDIH